MCTWMYINETNYSFRCVNNISGKIWSPMNMFTTFMGNKYTNDTSVCKHEGRGATVGVERAYFVAYLTVSY